MSDLTHQAPVDPLTGVPKRQAHDANAGYAHQYWLSVLSWLQISKEDLLVIEGVEDIDRISEVRAELMQIKRRSAELRLSTKEAAVAVGNYLVAVAKNSDHDLYFSYVTTAPAGVEPKTDFKTEKKGILIWKACEQSQEMHDDLAHDLLQLPELLRRPLKRMAAKAARKVEDMPLDEDDDYVMKNEEQALRYLDDHIREITSDHFLDSIIRRFRWDVSSPDTSDVEASVRSELAKRADAMEIRRPTLEECRFRLLARVIKAASGLNNGRLTAAELQAEIDYFLEMIDVQPAVLVNSPLPTAR